MLLTNNMAVNNIQQALHFGSIQKIKHRASKKLEVSHQTAARTY